MPSRRLSLFAVFVVVWIGRPAPAAGQPLSLARLDDWVAAPGVVVTALPEEGGGGARLSGDAVGLLCSRAAFSDFELRVEWRAQAGANSGVFLRSPCGCADPARDCYEVNIAPPHNPFPTGSLVWRAKVELPEPPAAERWHTFEVRAEGGELRVRLDGREVLVHQDPSPLPAGPIGLQHNAGWVEFRNLSLRPLTGQAEPRR